MGQDHTLALTKAGEVLSWGLNRFSQLGYPVDLPTTGRLEEPIQYLPRKIQGPLRKEVVKGVAASKVASACWTDDGVYTWGTNNGQLGQYACMLEILIFTHLFLILGYDKAAQPVQALPRKVSRLTVSVISIVMTVSISQERCTVFLTPSGKETVMACLMQNRQVECFYNDRHHRIRSVSPPTPIFRV